MHVMSGEQAVSAVHQRGNRGQQGQQGRKSRDTLKNPSYFKCKNFSYEHAPMKCPAFGKECHKCGRLNHALPKPMQTEERAASTKFGE